MSATHACCPQHTGAFMRDPDSESNIPIIVIAGTLPGALANPSYRPDGGLA